MDLQERLRRAAGPPALLATVLHDTSEEVLLALLDNPRLSEEHLFVVLSRKNLSRAFLSELVKREKLLTSHKVKLALLRHPRTPRSVSLTLLRHVYLFELVRLSTTPSASPEVRRAAEEAVVARLPALPLGERIALARQGSARIAAGLLADADAAVYSLALQNPRLSEEGVIRALRQEKVAPDAVRAIIAHPRWSARYDVRLALLRHPACSLAQMLALVETLRWQDLVDLEEDARMPAERRRYLAEWVRRRRRRQASRSGARRQTLGPSSEV